MITKMKTMGQGGGADADDVTRNFEDLKQLRIEFNEHRD